MERVPEPELMEDPAQARAYAEADFEAPHSMFIELCRERLGANLPGRRVLDLGCGPADVTLRFAEAFPDTELIGVDGSEAMLALGREAIAARGLERRIELVCARVPGPRFSQRRFDVIISNSLLHHLARAADLWRALRDNAAAGAAVFVMDLRRPASHARTQELVEQYASEEPEILRRDFFNSLCAAYTLEEVVSQLRASQLPYLTAEAVFDRHLLVWGYMQ